MTSGKLVDLVPTSFLVAILIKLISRRVRRLPPDQGIRFLFDLDSRLYPLQGGAAVSYGGGVHPKHRLTGFHEFFVERIKRDDRVIDVGCGIGALAHKIAERTGASVCGIDLSESNIDQARERFSGSGERYIVGRAPEALPQEDFDVAVLSNVLEHVPGRPDFIRRVQEATHVGRFLIRVPLFERDWRVPLKKELGIEWRLDMTHEIEYTMESFTQEISEAGLTIAYMEVRWGELWAAADSTA